MSTKCFFRDNALTLVLVGIFFVFIFGQAISGYYAYNQRQRLYHHPTVGLRQYLQTGNFLDAIFVNWQAAFFQLTVLIVSGALLRQRGSSHSRQPNKGGKRPPRPDEQSQSEPRRPVMRWIYEHSLSLAFLGLFLMSICLHGIFGAKAYNKELVLEHHKPIAVTAFFTSSKFWFGILQTAQGEFIAVALFVLFTVFLRQRGSSESKPVGEANQDTGTRED